MQLWMIRHGQARGTEECGGSDFDRTLTDEGRTAFGRLCRQLTEVPLPQYILHSPRLRAAQTATILRETLGLDESQQEAVTEFGQSHLLEDIRWAMSGRTEAVIAIVGHQPSVGVLTREITGAIVPFSPGTIAAIEFADGRIEPDAGTLLWYEHA
jgi:phosphohistidine phosphatase SixA